MAAKRANITDIILCHENQKDINEIKDTYLEGLSFHYIKEMKVMDKKKIILLKDLYENIEVVKNNLESFYNNINLAENDLIDYYIYRIRAEEAKYDYLIKLAKTQENKEG